MANNSRSERESARRARVEELRREQQAKERRRTLTVVGILGVVIAIVIALVAYSLISSDDSPAAGSQIIPTTPTGLVTDQKPAVKVPNTTGIKQVVAYDTTGYPGSGAVGANTLEHDHVTGPVNYSVIPPVGGPHSGIWMNAGVYTDPIPAERAVHNLEHGAIWITYRPGLPASEVQALTDFVGSQSLIDESASTGVAGQSNRFMDLSPWADAKLPAPIVISSWGYQLYVDQASDPRLQQFVDKFRQNTTYSPEPTSAVDGYPVQTAGRAAEFGGTKANPAGAAPSS